MTGCESCHGPGKAHAEEGDPTKIISFKNKSSKEISETCLAVMPAKKNTTTSVAANTGATTSVALIATRRITAMREKTWQLERVRCVMQMRRSLAFQR